MIHALKWVIPSEEQGLTESGAKGWGQGSSENDGGARWEMLRHKTPHYFANV